MFEPMEFKFKFSEAFDADDPVSAWVFNLARCGDDLLRVFKGLEHELEEKKPNNAFFFFKLSIALYREGAQLVNKERIKNERIQVFIQNLPSSMLNEYHIINKSIEKWEQSFVNTKLVPIRNWVIHYWDKKEPSLTSTAFADLDDFHTSVSVNGETFSDVSLQFAEEILFKIWFKSQEEFMSVVKEMRTYMGPMIKFSSDTSLFYLIDYKKTIILQN